MSAFLEKVCAICTKPFRTTHRGANGAKQKYCGPECRAKSQTRRSEGTELGLPTGTVGAVHELQVAIDLMKRGFAVYRSLSPSAKADLVVVQGRAATRVEVTTGYKSHSDPTRLIFPKKDRGDFDVLAIVLADEIVYQPPWDC